MLIYSQRKWNTIVFHNIKRTSEMNISKLFFGGIFCQITSLAACLLYKNFAISNLQSFGTDYFSWRICIALVKG